MTRRKHQPIDRNNIEVHKSYTVPEVAECVGWSAKWLRQLIREGRVKGFKPGGYEFRIPGEEVKRICENLENHRTVGPKKSALDKVPLQTVNVSPEQMRKMDPNWQPQQEEPPSKPDPDDDTESAPRRTFDDTVRDAFPILFPGDN